jgi:uncharacterized protein YozE (UPF0346 family)
MGNDFVDPVRPPAFHYWLIHQSALRRNDRVSDLILDVRFDNCWPTDTDDLDALRRHLDDHGAIEGAHETLEIAYREWRELVWRSGTNR